MKIQKDKTIDEYECILDDMGELKEINNDSAGILRYAIVEQAIVDYANINRRLGRERAKKEYQQNKGLILKYTWELEGILDFFESQWFEMLCDLDKDKLINLLKSKTDVLIKKKEQAQRTTYGKERQTDNIKTKIDCH